MTRNMNQNESCCQLGGGFPVSRGEHTSTIDASLTGTSEVWADKNWVPGRVVPILFESKTLTKNQTTSAATKRECFVVPQFTDQ